MTTENEESTAEGLGTGSNSTRSTDETGTVVDHADASTLRDTPSRSDLPAGRSRIRRRRLLTATLASLALAIVVALGIPWIRQALNTVSTDDAYVNGHVTFVAARVPGQVSRVLVEDNNHVHKGDLLVELDKEPFEVEVAVKQAAVDRAKVDVEMAKASVRSIEAKARSERWELQHAMEDVQNQIALLDAKVAAVNESKAKLGLAKSEFNRAKNLIVSGAVSREEVERREAALSVAQAEVTQALDDANRIRVSLGLPAGPLNGGDLGQVPPDLDQTFSSVRQAQANLIQSAAELGVIHSYNQSPKQMLEQFKQLDSQGDVDKFWLGSCPRHRPSSRPRRNSNPPSAISIGRN